MGYLKKAMRGSFAILFFTVVSAFLGFLLRTLFARYLSINDFGLFYAVFSFINFFIIFRQLGLNASLTRFIPHFLVKKDLKSIKSGFLFSVVLQFSVAVLIAIALIIFSSQISDFYFKTSSAKIILVLLSLSFCLTTIIYIIRAVFLGFQNFKLYASVDFFMTAVVLIFSFILFNLGFGVLGAATAYLVMPILTILFYFFLLIFKAFPKFLKTKFDISFRFNNYLLFFSLPILLGTAGNLLLDNLGTIMITYFDTLKQVGLYNVAMPTAKLIYPFAIAATGILLPMSSELWAKGFKEHLSRGVRLIYKYLFIMLVPIFSGIAIFSSLIINTLFGADYAAASNILKILSASLIFLIFWSINNSIFIGTSKPKMSAILMGIGLPIFVVLNFLLIPSYGALGAAYAHLTAYFVMFFVGLVYMAHIKIFKFPLADWTKTLISLVFFVIIAIYLKNIFLDSILSAIIICSIALLPFILLHFMFRVVSINEFKSFVGILKQKFVTFK